MAARGLTALRDQAPAAQGTTAVPVSGPGARGQASASQIVWLALAITLFCLRDPIALLSGLPPEAAALASVVLFLLAARGRGGALVWAALVVGVAGFERLRSVVPMLGLPLHASDLWHLEQGLFLGIFPSHALQAALYTPGHVGALDYAAMAVHGSFFVVPYVVLGAVWLVMPRSAARLALLLVLTFGAGLAVNALLPAEPPWLASSQGGSHYVHRVIYEARLAIDPGVSRYVDERLGDPNPTASLPSLHFAITFALYLYGRAHGRASAALGGIYTVAMGLALVYLGEHYVVDLLFGGAVAVGAWQAGQRVHLEEAGRSVGRRVSQWSPALLWPDRTGSA